MIPIDRLHEYFSCDPATGVITWKVQKGRARAGGIAGCVGARGYLRICIDGQLHPAHRLVWAMCTGEWPPDTDIDHKDENKLNNALSNLRIATRSQNKQNVSNHRGCFLHQGKWVALIKIDGVTQRLGSFDTEELAHAAYLDAKKVHHPFWSGS